MKQSPIKEFFLKQAQEWKEQGFTCRMMAIEMQKHGLYVGWYMSDIQSRLNGYTVRYCTEVGKVRSSPYGWSKVYKLIE